MKRSSERAGPPAEAWTNVFHFGHDYLGDLEPWGLRVPVLAHPLPGPEREAATEAWGRTAKAAWETHGRSFMATWKPDGDRQRPWALEAFGEPE